MKAGLLGMFLLTLATTTAAPQTQFYELIARAKSLELDTHYVPPPGDPLACSRLRQGYVLGRIHNWSRAGFCC